MSKQENVDADQTDKRLLLSILGDLAELSTAINRTHSQLVILAARKGITLRRSVRPS